LATKGAGVDKGLICAVATTIAVTPGLSWSAPAKPKAAPPAHAFIRLRDRMYGEISYLDVALIKRAAGTVQVSMLSVQAFRRDRPHATLARYEVSCDWGYIRALPGWKDYDARAVAKETPPEPRELAPWVPYIGSSTAAVTGLVCGKAAEPGRAGALSLGAALQQADAELARLIPPLPVPPVPSEKGFPKDAARLGLLMRGQGYAPALFIDWSDLRRKDAIAEASALIVLGPNTPAGQPAVVYRVTRYDCQARTLQVRGRFVWSLDGEFMFTERVDDPADVVRPGSPGAAELDAICTGGPPAQTFATIGEAVAFAVAPPAPPR
jgi:hypothetical protein